MSGAQIQTVRGPIPAADLGVCLLHEHLLLNLEWIDARVSLHGILDNEELVLEELKAVPAAVGQSSIRLRRACGPTRWARVVYRQHRVCMSSWAAAGTASPTIRPKR